jgi:hypothetical protein
LNFAVACSKNNSQDVHKTDLAVEQRTSTVVNGEVKGNSLIGKWENLSDPKQVVVYEENYTAKVFYNDKLSDTFQWEEVNEIKNPKIKFEYKAGSIFIREFTSEGSDRYYLIDSLDENHLEIRYTYNGKILKYERK